MNAQANDRGNAKLVAIALVVALLAVVLINVYLGMVRSAAEPGSFLVFRLQTRLEPGDKLQQRDVEAVRVPKQFSEAFQDAVQADENGEPMRLGETIRQPAAMNEVITYDLFQEPDDQRLDVRIASGQRAIALPVEPRHVPGGLEPGMHVDIEAPFASDHGEDVLPVMERVKVLMVGDRGAHDRRSGRSGLSGLATISIEVSPEEATQLTEIEKLAVGPFELHLRNPADENTPKLDSRGINPKVLKKLEDTTTARQPRR
jgi:Flp pilus assembly protein CpaB